MRTIAEAAAPPAHDGDRARRAQLAYFGLGVILALALVLRLNALDWFLPQATEPDNDVVHQIYLLEADVPPAERPGVYARYPLLLADLARLIPARSAPSNSGPSGANEGANSRASSDLVAHMHAAHDVTLRLRAISAVASVGLVLLTWFLARRLAGPGASLLTPSLAAFFVATSLLHLLFSQQARPHALHATLAALAVLAAIRLRERPTTAAYLAAGLTAGLAAACLQSGLATFAPLVAAIVLRERGTGGEGADARVAANAGAKARDHGRLKGVLAMALACGLTLAFQPGATQPEYDGTKQELEIESGTLRFGGHTIELAEFDGSGFGRMARFLWEHDPVLTAAAALGLLVCWMHWRTALRNKSLLVVLAYAVPYAIAIGLYRQTFDRFLLPLLPYVACLAGYGVERAMHRIRSLRVGGGAKDPVRSAPMFLRVAAAALAVLVLALPSFAALRFARVLRARDTYERAADWLSQHAESHGATIIVTPGMILPVFYDASAIEHAMSRLPSFWYARTRWIHYQAGLPPSPQRGPEFRIIDIPVAVAESDPKRNPEIAERFLAAYEPRYALIENSQRMTYFPGLRAISDRVREEGDLVWMIDGEAATDPEWRPFAYQDIGGMLCRLLHLSQLGPRIEIYELPER